MATNYGYVKQDTDSQVNWGEVGKTFTDMLSAENKRREDLKTEIDTNTRTDLERLAQIPKGSSEDYNKWTTDAADKIAQARLLQVKELKSGRLSLKDYNNYRQNTVSGVNNMVATIKSYNAWYENGMKRAEKMESGAAEIWKNSLIESMKFKDTTPNIGLDGSMSVTKLVKNPKTGLMEVSDNPADAFSFSSMLDFGKKQFDRFKAAETLDGLSKTVGDYVKVLNQGNIGLVKNIWQTDSSGKYTNPQIGAIQNQVRASIANPNNAMSVLVDFKGVTPSGGKYEFTNDPNDPRLKGADRENIIFMDATMSPQLTEGQMKTAEDIMIEGLKARSDNIETAFEKRVPAYTGVKKSAAELKQDAENKIKFGYLRTIEDMQTGTPEQFEADANDLVANMNSINESKDIDRTIGKVQRTDSEFIIPITTVNPVTKQKETLTERIPRKDASGKLLSTEIVGQSLSRLLTPMTGSYRENVRQFNENEGGYGKGKPNVTPAKGGRAVSELPNISLTNIKLGKTDATVALTNAVVAGSSETSDAIQKILVEGLKGTNSKAKVSVDANMFTNDIITIDIDGKKYNYEYESDSIAAELGKDLPDIINEKRAKANKENIKKDISRPKVTTTKPVANKEVQSRISNY